MSYLTTFLRDNINVVSIILALFTLDQVRRFQQRRQLPPGPWGFPGLGNIGLLFNKDKRKLFRSLRKKFGDLFIMSLGSRHILVVSGKDMLNEMLHSKDFDKRPPVFTVLKVGQGKAVVNGSGPVWKEHRSFMIKCLKEFDVGKSAFEPNVMDELHPLRKVLEASNGQDFDPMYCIKAAVSSIVCAISFGKRFDYDDPQFQEFVTIFDDNMYLVGSTAIINYFPSLEYLPGDPFKSKRMLKNMKDVQTILRTWIDHHKQTLDPDNPRDILDHYLLEMRYKQERNKETTMDDGQLLKFIGDLFAGGTETTSITIRWGIAFLVHHPEIQDRLYKEIVETLGTRNQLTLLDRKSMPYAKAVITETQRLADIAPFALAHSNFEPVRLGKYVIPAGTVVIPNLNSVHLDPDIWENPETFDPTRFLDEYGEHVQRSEWMPFSVGPRQCPGLTLASMELFLVLTFIVQHFQIHPAQSEGLPAYEGHVGITFVPNPYKVRFVKRTADQSQRSNGGNMDTEQWDSDEDK